MDFGTRFTFTREGELFSEIKRRAKEARPVLKQWCGFLKAGAKKALKDKAPPKSPATIEKQTHQGSSSVTAHGKVRASYAKKLDKTLRRKGNQEALQALHQLVGGQGKSWNRAVDRLQRRLKQAQAIKSNAAVARNSAKQKAADAYRNNDFDNYQKYSDLAKGPGPKLAIGKRTIERSPERGGKMGGAFKALIKGFKAVIENAVSYSKVHDEGGTVGNNASLPKWGFMYIDQSGAKELAQIALNWLIRGKQ